MSKAGEITDAHYDEGTNRVHYNYETDDGLTGSGTLTERAYGPDTELSAEALEQLAEELPGTPLYDRTDGGMFDPETLPTPNMSIGVVHD